MNNKYLEKIAGFFSNSIKTGIDRINKTDSFFGKRQIDRLKGASFGGKRNVLNEAKKHIRLSERLNGERFSDQARTNIISAHTPKFNSESVINKSNKSRSPSPSSPFEDPNKAIERSKNKVLA
jgi:hypothetical protein